MAEDHDASESVDEIADHLYGLDPDEFVSARDQRAKELRSKKERIAANEVKALRRPTVAAWAVNRLVRVDPGAVDELLEVSRRLVAAQRDALAGGQSDVRSSSARRQQLLDALADRAKEIIEASGRASSLHERDIVRTLQATSDADSANELRRGRLVTALEPVSAIDGLTAWYTESGAMASASKRDATRERQRARRAADDAVAAAEAVLHDAELEVDRLRGELHVAERRVEQATQQLAERRAASKDASDD